jgi:hypothetical protein
MALGWHGPRTGPCNARERARPIRQVGEVGAPQMFGQRRTDPRRTVIGLRGDEPSAVLSATPNPGPNFEDNRGPPAQSSGGAGVLLPGKRRPAGRASDFRAKKFCREFAHHPVLEGVALFLLIAAAQADVQHPFAPADRRIAR